MIGIDLEANILSKTEPSEQAVILTNLIVEHFAKSDPFDSGYLSESEHDACTLSRLLTGMSPKGQASSRQ